MGLFFSDIKQWIRELVFSSDLTRASVRSSLRSAVFPPLSARCASLSEQESPPKKSAPSNSPVESSEVRDALTESVTRSTTFSAPRREPSRKKHKQKRPKRTECAND